jgi:hypothetical protein
MRPSEPPVLATWLLEHVRFSNTDEALAGDLLEDFRHGRSVAWYWRQVFAAILVGFVREVRHHWVLAIRAVVIGLIANYGALVLGHEVFVALYRHRVLNVGFFPPLAAWIVQSFCTGVVSGSSVALLHRKHQDAMLLAFAGALLVWASMLRAVFFTANSPLFVTLAITYYVAALAGVLVAGFLVSPGPKIDPQRKERQSPAC